MKWDRWYKRGDKCVKIFFSSFFIFFLLFSAYQFCVSGHVTSGFLYFLFLPRLIGLCGALWRVAVYEQVGVFIYISFFLVWSALWYAVVSRDVTNIFFYIFFPFLSQPTRGTFFCLNVSLQFDFYVSFFLSFFSVD